MESIESISKRESKWLNALRGLAALSVVTVHFGQIFAKNATVKRFETFTNHGKHGVALFFVLSAYLLTNKLKNKTIDIHRYKNFIIKRFFRIYPAYFICLLILQLFYNYDFNQFFSHLLLLHFMNARLFGGIDYPFWSLGIEFWFYALLPFILLVQRKTKVNYLIIFSFFIGLAWESLAGLARIHFHFDQNYNWSSRFFLITSLPAFALGISGALQKSFGKLVDKIILLGALIAIIDIFVGALPECVRVIAILHSISNFAFKGSLGFLVYGCLSLFLIRKVPKPNKIMDVVIGIFSKIGRFSFSLYLWHVPIFLFISKNYGTSFRFQVLSIFAASIFGYVSYYLIEKPMLIFSTNKFRY